MRNKQAERYARWSAGVAVGILLVVTGFFVQGRLADRTARRNLLPAVPPSVEQQSTGFTYSKNVGKHTLFTIRASQATEYKDKNRSLLENVSITIYGAAGNRDDSVHAGACSYQPDTGSIRCAGAVQIDLRNAAKNDANDSRGALHLETSGVLFGRDSGEVSTKNSVTLRFPGGTGQGTGMIYDPQTEDAKLESNVQLKMTPPHRFGGTPVSLVGSALEFRRSDGTLRLFGPVRAEQGQRILTAGTLEIDLDGQMRPRRAVAGGQPRIVASDARGEASLAANRMEAVFVSSGAIAKMIAEGSVGGGVRTQHGENKISADSVQLVMAVGDRSDEPREMLARGNVHAVMQLGETRRDLQTAALQIDFAPIEIGRRVRVVRAETLAPGEIMTSQAGVSGTIQGGKLMASFDARGRLAELRGSSGVKVIQKDGSQPPQESNAENLAATFGADGAWEKIQESGGVKLEQAGRTGQAEQAEISRAEDVLTLTGSAAIEDAMSRLSAEQIVIHQKTGDVRATGKVVASYSGGPGKATNPLNEPANVSADGMIGSNTGGHAVFSGHARLWEGNNVLQANTIEFWRSQKRIEARGDVVGAFSEPSPKTANVRAKGGVPAVWRVRAPRAEYLGNAGQVEMTGGVTAESEEGSIFSRTLTLFLTRTGNQPQALERAVAEGSVRIEQNGRVGTAEQGEYVAREGKFVLSGGQPVLLDGSGNTTTGRELTFFLASDTILVDSQKTPRNMTRHRVEK